MNKLIASACLSAALCLPTLAQKPEGQSTSSLAAPPLDQEVSAFELKDGSIIDGLAELSRNPDLRLHLGIEEVLREKLATPRDRTVHFSLRLDHKSVREILTALCESDPRYAWSVDGSTIDVFPRARAADGTNLLNFRISEIHLIDAPDPDQALTPLSKEFPSEQIGYMHMGGDDSYSVPWNAVFQNCTVRQFMNRITERIGPVSSWIWQGGKDSRMFTFVSSGFYTR